MSEQTSAPRPMTSGFLGKEVYVVTTRPVGQPISREMMQKHLENQVALEKEGIMFAAGPLFATPESQAPEAGLIVIRAASFDEANQIAMRDPLHSSGLRTYTLQRWVINEGSYSVTISYSDQKARID